MSASNLVLPYATEDSSRKNRFSESMEIAALLCIAEADRKKKPGLLGGGEEALTFLSKVFYPLWLIPWENSSLLIDGMGIISDNILYFKQPDIEAFIEHLKRSTTVQELYHNALRSHIETFSEFTSQTEIPIEGLATDKQLLSDMLVFLKEEKTTTNLTSSEAASSITPKISQEKSVRIREEIQEHYNTLESEVKGLQFTISTMTEETSKHADKLRAEEKHIQERYTDEISRETARVKKKKEELEKERDEKIGKITAGHKEEIEARRREKKKWEQELLKLEQNKSEFQKRKALRKQKGDEIGETRWAVKLRDVQNQMTSVKGKIKALSDFINRNIKETEKTTKDLRATCKKRLDKEEKKIFDLENSRTLEVEKKRKQRDELEQETLGITDKIERLIDQKRERSSMLKEAAIPWKTNAPTLVHVPFYLIRYETEKERRHLVRPPAVARGHEGLAVKIRKIGSVLRPGSKMSALLKSRSKAIEKIFTDFEGKLESDREVQKAINQIDASSNLLNSADFKEKVRKGMDELDVEGWIKPEDKETIANTYLTA